LAFERSTSSEVEGRELEVELRGFWNKGVGNKGGISFYPNCIKKFRLGELYFKYVNFMM